MDDTNQIKNDSVKSQTKSKASRAKRPRQTMYLDDEIPCTSKDVINSSDFIPNKDDRPLEIMESVEMDRLLDQKLEEAATRRNLSVFNVKRLLKEVLTDQDVVHMFRSYVSGEAVEGEGVCYEPRITRSTTRLAENTGSLPAVFGSQALGGVSLPAPPRILDLDFPEEGDEEDLDYQPTREDEELEETDLALDVDQDGSSIDCLVPSPGAVTTTPAEDSANTTQSSAATPVGEGGEDQEAPPALRTRSRAPIADELESLLLAGGGWQPPDVTPDMYGPPPTEEELDEDYRSYLTFLDSLFTDLQPPQPGDCDNAGGAGTEETGLVIETVPPDRQSTPNPLLGQDGDEEDPEFNLMLEPEEVYQEDFLEDIRNDKSVKVPKWEIKELFDDLYGLFPSDEEPDTTQVSSVDPNTSQITSDHEDTSNDVFNRPPIFKVLIPPPPEEQSTTNTATNLEVKDLINLQTNVIPHFTTIQYATLRRQIAMHIQMLASNYIMLKDNEPPVQLLSAPPAFSGVTPPISTVIPGHTSLALQQIDYAEEIDRFRENSENFHQWSSVWSVRNLVPALDLIRQFNGVNRTLIVDFLRPTMFYKETSFPQCFSQIFLKSSAFVYPRLLPPRYIVYNCKSKQNLKPTLWLPVEDSLFALGSIQFGYQLTSAFKHIHRYLLPIRSPNQMSLRKTNLVRRKDNLSPDNPMRLLLHSSRLAYHDLSQLHVSSWVADLPLDQPNLPIWNHTTLWDQLPPDIKIYIARNYPEVSAEAGLPKTNELRKMRHPKSFRSPNKVEHRNFNISSRPRWLKYDPINKETLVNRDSQVEKTIKMLTQKKRSSSSKVVPEPIELINTDEGCFVKVPATILLPFNVPGHFICSKIPDPRSSMSDVIQQTSHSQDGGEIVSDFSNFLTDSSWPRPFQQSSPVREFVETEQLSEKPTQFITVNVSESAQLQFQGPNPAMDQSEDIQMVDGEQANHSQDIADFLALFNSSKDEIDVVERCDLQNDVDNTDSFIAGLQSPASDVRGPLLPVEEPKWLPPSFYEPRSTPSSTRKRQSPFSPEAVAAKSVRRARRVLLARSSRVPQLPELEMAEEQLPENMPFKEEVILDGAAISLGKGSQSTEVPPMSGGTRPQGELSVLGVTCYQPIHLENTQFYGSLTQLMLCSRQAKPSRIDILRGRRFREKCQCQSLAALVMDESIDPTGATFDDETDLEHARTFLDRMRHHLLSRPETQEGCTDDSSYEQALHVMVEMSRHLQDNPTDDSAVLHLWSTLAPLLPDVLRDDLKALLLRKQIVTLDMLHDASRLMLVDRFYHQLRVAQPSKRYWSRMKNLLRDEATDQIKVLQRCASGLRLNPLVQAHLVTLHAGHTPYSGFPAAFEEINDLGQRDSAVLPGDKQTIPTATEEVDDHLGKNGLTTRLSCPCQCHEHLRPRTKPKKVDSLGLRHCIRCSLRVYSGVVYIDECNFHLTNVAITWPPGFVPRSPLRRPVEIPKGMIGKKLSRPVGERRGGPRRRAVRKDSTSGLHDFLTMPNSTVDPAGMRINLENVRDTSSIPEQSAPQTAKERKTAATRRAEPSITDVNRFFRFSIDEETCFNTESFAPLRAPSPLPPPTPPPPPPAPSPPSPPLLPCHEEREWSEAEDRCILEHCKVAGFCSAAYSTVPWPDAVTPWSSDEVQARIKFLMRVYLASVGDEYFSEDFEDDVDDET